MQQEILFDEMTAKDVAECLRVIRENQQAVNIITLMVARMNGWAPPAQFKLNDAGTGIVIIPEIRERPTDDGRGWEVETPQAAEIPAPPPPPKVREVKESLGKK